MSAEAVDVITAPEAAISALDPVRSRLLAELAAPRSAAELARELDLPRQRVGYHLRQLQERGLVTAAGQRRWGGITERLLVATARAYLVSPEALGPSAAFPADGERPDRLSAAYLAAVGGRLVREVGALIRRSRETGQPAETFALDTEITFASPQARADFARELADAVTGLVARYHDERSGDGRRHRLVVGAHPIPTPTPVPPDSRQDTDQEESDV